MLAPAVSAGESGTNLGPRAQLTVTRTQLFQPQGVIELSLSLQSLGDLRLRTPDGGDVLRRRRKELAMLVVIAARAPRPVRREELQALFWGERDEQRARHSLRQTLLRLRRACGNDALEIAPDTLRLHNGAIVFDVRQFGDAASAGRYRDAIGLWTGDFLVGCEDVGGEEFRSWMEAERARLRRLLYSCYERLADELQALGDWAELSRWSARWTDQFDVDEVAAARLVESLCHGGNASEAVAERAAFLSRTRAIGDEPTSQWLERTERAIEDAKVATPIEVLPAPRDSAVAADERPLRAAPHAPRHARLRGVVATASAIALIAIAWRLSVREPSHERSASSAAGRTDTIGPHDSSAASPGLVPGTRSLSASRLYEEGLHAYYAGESQTAGRFFRAALNDDSTFAMAAYYAAVAPFGPNSNELLQRARAMAKHGSDHDRLFIEAQWLGMRDEPTQLVVAETLAIRYPADPKAHFAYARALVRAGRFNEAIPYYRRVITTDTLGLDVGHGLCLACDAYGGLLDAYRFADSMPATERVAREWVTRQPRSPFAWNALSDAHKVQGRYREALDALAIAARLDVSNHARFDAPLDLWLRMGDFASADRFSAGQRASPGRESQANGLSAAVSSFRVQGRLLEALGAAVKGRRLSTTREQPVGEAILHATVLFDLGRYREAVALFDSLSAPNLRDSEARQGRNRAWFLTHAATAAAAMGDTVTLRLLEDTIRVRGGQSGFRRDQLLHHYVRGLRLRLNGSAAAAAESFRRSLHSPVEGNTRASVELARTLLDLGRPAEAVRVLRSAHWGPVGASGQYVNRTELEALLAQAFDASNQPDSAAAHYAWVLKAWQRADPSLRDEKRQIEERAKTLAVR